MKRLMIYTVALALLGGVTGLPSPTFAQDLELEIDRDGSTLRLRDDYCDPRYERCRDERRREREGRRYCTQERALEKAQRMGIRRARIVESDRRVIVVGGRDRFGDRIRILFGRDRSCPVLR